MPTTTNNGWDIPADTDLVKNGALAIRTLGQDIDTTLGVYTASTPGLTKISTTTFSASSAVNINNVFSSTYDNYRIVFHHSKSTSASSTIRLRVSGADETASNYGMTWIYLSGTTIAQYQVNGTSFNLTGVSTSTQATVLDIITPFDNTFNTLIIGQTLTGIYATNPEVASNWGRYNANTSYTGLSIIPSAGTISGTVSVYGYNK
jgi:hypothetical protein